MDIVFDCKNVKLDKDYGDNTEAVHLEVGYYDQYHDCESEVFVYLTRNDVIQIVKTLGITTEELV